MFTCKELPAREAAREPPSVTGAKEERKGGGTEGRSTGALSPRRRMVDGARVRELNIYIETRVCGGHHLHPARRL